jgi:hypothetical protein
MMVAAAAPERLLATEHLYRCEELVEVDVHNP